MQARGPRSGWVLGGAAAGLALAAATIGAATLRARSPGTVADLLGVVFAVWALGWMLGPAYAGQPVLRAEQFRLLPVPRRRLALGLLGAAFAGVTAPVTFIAFTALVVFGIRLGMVPALIAVPAVVLQLILVVLLSRVTGSLFGALSRSRAGAVVSALLTAVMLVASSSGWLVLAALHPLVDTGFPAGFAAAVRALPSSWAVLAVEASSRSDWLMTAAPLLGLIAVLLLLWLTWERSLGPARWPRPAVRGSPAGRAAPRRWMPAGATAAVLVKELRTWRRDPQRLTSLVVPPAFAVMTCLGLAALGTRAFLPFAGALTALMAAVTSANLYGQDGTALWLTLLIPGSERADVRGRQLAWLALFAPMTLVLTAAGMAASGRPDLWPGALAATFALLGGGAGLLPAVAIALPAPGPGPRDRNNAPLGDTDALGPALVMLFLALATAAPAAGTVLAGELTGRPALRWAALAVGVITGDAGLCAARPRGTAEPYPARPRAVVPAADRNRTARHASQQTIPHHLNAQIPPAPAVVQPVHRLHRALPPSPDAAADEAFRRARASLVPRAVPARGMAMARDHPDVPARTGLARAGRPELDHRAPVTAVPP